MTAVMGGVHDPGHLRISASDLQTHHVNFIDVETGQ